MCGIVGYIGPQDATPVILNGLKRLEYRGYDSTGVALQNGGLHVGSFSAMRRRFSVLRARALDRWHGHCATASGLWLLRGFMRDKSALRLGRLWGQSPISFSASCSGATVVLNWDLSP